MTTTYQLMYDSTCPCEIPSKAPLVAPYVDGIYAWSPSQMARFASSRKLLLSVEGDPDASAFDVEQGACSTSELVVALRARRKRGLASAVYCALGSWQATLTALTAEGLADLPSYWWIAHPTTPAGTPGPAPAQLPVLGKRFSAFAQQYYWGPPHGPGCWDLSIVDPAALNILGLFTGGPRA